jgi:hypothetical protein
LLSAAAQSASLNNDYGANKGVSAPVSHEVALFNGDPVLGGTELAATGGYARVTITNNGTTWPDASAGATTSATVTFPTSTAAWSDTATHFVLYDHADSVTQWDSGLLKDEISVDAAGEAPRAELTIYYEDPTV